MTTKLALPETVLIITTVKNVEPVRKTPNNGDEIFVDGSGVVDGARDCADVLGGPVDGSGGPTDRACDAGDSVDGPGRSVDGGGVDGFESPAEETVGCIDGPGRPTDEAGDDTDDPSIGYSFAISNISRNIIDLESNMNWILCSTSSCDVRPETTTSARKNTSIPGVLRSSSILDHARSWSVI